MTLNNSFISFFCLFVYSKPPHNTNLLLWKMIGKPMYISTKILKFLHLQSIITIIQIKKKKKNSTLFYSFINFWYWFLLFFFFINFSTPLFSKVGISDLSFNFVCFLLFFFVNHWDRRTHTHTQTKARKQSFKLK